MINISPTEKQLIAMTPSQRKQYVQMHKSNPYIVSMALNIDNHEKAIRLADQARNSPAEQPKIVDQFLAQMGNPPPAQMAQAQAQPMPEDVGIGALPAPNMQGMAGGGIVAFGGGGDVPGAKPLDQTATAAIQEAQRSGDRNAIVQTLKQLGAAGYDVATLIPRAFMGVTEDIANTRLGRALGVDFQFPQSAYGGDRSSMTPMMDRVLRADGITALPAAAAATTPAPVAAAPAVVTPGVTPTGGIGNLTQPVTAMPPVAAPAPAPTPAAGGPRAPVAAPRAPAVPEMGFAERFSKAMGTAPDFEAKRAASLATEKAGEETGLAKLKADQESEMASMFKGREERVGKREAALEKSKDTNTGMAFLEAGLAMMQSRGRGLAGIAEGAAVGTKQYASGIKDIRAAQEKLDDARDRMEELRQNQSSMNKRDVRIAEKSIRDIVNRGNEKQLDAAEKLYNVKREDAKTALVSDLAVSEAAKTRAFQGEQGALDRASRKDIAGMPGDQQRMLTTLGGKGGLEAGLAKMQEIQADKTGAAYAKLFTETVAEANKAGVTPPTAAQFAASLRQLATAMNPAKVPGAVDVATPGRT